MTEKSIIIIGAGIAGLSAGCYAQMSGYRSQIFEHRSKPGGVAAAWKRGEYLIDGGIHFLMGSEPGSSLMEIYKELGTCGPEALVPMDSYGRFIDETSGKGITITTDLDKLSLDLKKQFPRDDDIIDDLIENALSIRGIDMGIMEFSRPPELGGSFDSIIMMWKGRKYLKYFTGKYVRSVQQFTKSVHDPFLKVLIRNLFLPEVPVWFVIMILALLVDRKMAMLKGGCLDFIVPMERRYKELGGKTTYKATVKEIILEDHKAVGIRLEDGSEHRSDIVISAADGHSTIFDMLHGKYLDKSLKERYSKWGMVRPMLMASFGVAREFPGEPHFTMIMLEDPIIINERPVAALSLRIVNRSRAPPISAR